MNLIDYFMMGSERPELAKQRHAIRSAKPRLQKKDEKRLSGWSVPRTGGSFDTCILPDTMTPEESVRKVVELAAGQLAFKEAARQYERPFNEGPNRVIRVGGDTRTAVVPLNLDNPYQTFEQLAEISRRRASALLHAL